MTLNLGNEITRRVERAFKAYWLSPFCSGTIEIGETLMAWALQAELLASKGYADVFNAATQIAYQIKTGLPSSPVTFARLTTPSQFELVNHSTQKDLDRLGGELLLWVRQRITEPYQRLDAVEVRVARMIYTKTGNFTYYERRIDPTLYDPRMYTWQWSLKGNALEGYREGNKWFSWYPQGRQDTKNQNQLHYHGENKLVPPIGSPSRHDFHLGPPAQIPFDDFLDSLLRLID